MKNKLVAFSGFRICDNPIDETIYINIDSVESGINYSEDGSYVLLVMNSGEKYVIHMTLEEIIPIINRY